MPDARIIAIAGDPGGATCVAPVIARLRDSGRFAVEAWGYYHAGAVFSSMGIDFQHLPEDAGAAALPILDAPDVALFLTGTSDRGISWEKRYVNEARARGIPSIAVLDFWSSYVDRFCEAGGERLAFVPDRIAVMDERAVDEMAALGFDRDALVPTGQPAYDDLAACLASFTDADREAIRRRLGVPDGKRMISFISQPFIYAFGAADEEGHSGYGYDERQALLAVKKAAAEAGGPPCVIVVRPHPREDADAIDRTSIGGVECIVTREGTPREVVLASDLVTGMNSALLLEACYLRRVVLSVQPGLHASDDPLPTNASGHSVAVYRKEDVAHELARLLHDEPARREMVARCAGLNIDGRATERVANLCERLAKGGPA